MRVLIVEDDEKLAKALEEGLRGEGHDVVVERSGEGGFFRVNTEAFDQVLLDLSLPERHGLEVLKAIRERGLTVPVLVITARDTPADRVIGLDAGADDYLVKPFSFAELLARLRALARRGRPTDVAVLQCADLEMDLATRRVTRRGRVVELTVREFEVLECLVRHAGQVVSRETLARVVWKQTDRTPTLDNVIDVHIARLRRKADLNEAGRLIHTIRGVGFLLREGEV
jgi:two-component system copper resistance phosphate regulon response regulator CusR